MNRFRARALLGAAAVLVLPPAGPGATAEPEPAPFTLAASHRARALHPGEVVRLHVTSSGPVEVVYGTAFDRPVHFFASGDGAWEGLLGIDVDTPAGEYAVAIRAIGSDGAPVTLTHSLQVAPREFETRRLSVDPAFVNPPAAMLPRIRRERDRLAEVYNLLTPERLWRGAFHAPVPGPPTSSFGRLSVFNSEPRSRHRGTDFRAAEGAPVRAPADGRVVLSADLYFAGGSVILDHGWGLFSQFAHLSSRDVEEGVLVEAGQIIGRVGATGRVTGPHLHWSVRVGPASVDPLSLMAVLADE